MKNGCSWFCIVGWVIAIICGGLLILTHSTLGGLEDNIALLKEDLAKYQSSIDELTSQKADIEIKLDNEKKLREELDKKIKELEVSNSSLIYENSLYKKAIATFSDEKIVEEIGKNVGSENVALANSDIKQNERFIFSLTRIGGEKTLSLFRDATDYFNLANDRLNQISLLNDEIVSFKKTNELTIKKLDLTEQALNQANKVILDYDNQLSIIKKKSRASTFKKVGVGVLIGFATCLIVDK